MEATCGCGARHTQVILLFLSVILAYGMRVNMSVGIVAMTDKNTSPNPDVLTFDWDDQSIILTSFFIGYVIPQVIAGHMAKNFGAKIFITVTSIVGSLMAILIPIVAPLGSWAVILCRVIQGLAQGFLYPCIHNLLSKWVPPLERARLSTFVYAGGPLGTVVSMPFTGWISGTHLGWPYAFYIYGGAGLLWTVLWVGLGKNSPADHKDIRSTEKEYIEMSLGATPAESLPSKTPWAAFFKSLPVWALIFAHSGQNWGFSTLITNIPTYMADVLQFDIKSNGVLSAGPYLLNWIVTISSGAIIDYVIAKKYLSVGVARKVANSIGLCIPAITLLTLGLISDTEADIRNVALVLLFVAVGSNGSVLCGYHVNHMDLSPVYAGTLMGITNTVANFFGIIAPLLVHFIVTEPRNAMLWAIVFYISSAVYVIGSVVFVIFGSGEIQAWNNS